MGRLPVVHRPARRARIAHGVATLGIRFRGRRAAGVGRAHACAATTARASSGATSGAASTAATATTTSTASGGECATGKRKTSQRCYQFRLRRHVCLHSNRFETQGVVSRHRRRQSQSQRVRHAKRGSRRPRRQQSQSARHMPGDGAGAYAPRSQSTICFCAVVILSLPQAAPEQGSRAGWLPRRARLPSAGPRRSPNSVARAWLSARPAGSRPG